ncbi:MAG: J domain-containing protein [Armatimonadota bacterium]|nr:J domain-containing protein [Armatimonadota bacterium]
MAEEFRKDVDYYEVLQVHPRAHPLVIQKVYHVLMRDLRHHPDLGGDVRMAQLINEAYRVLSDPAQRAAYDRFRAEAGIRTELPGQGQTVTTPLETPAVHAELLGELTDALQALGAWPPRKTPPPFCRIQVGGIEVGSLIQGYRFRFTGPIRTEERAWEGLELRSYAQPERGLWLLLVCAEGVVGGGMLSGPRQAVSEESLLGTFLNEVTGGAVDPKEVARLLQAVEYLDQGDRRRRTRAFGLWLVAVTRIPGRTTLILVPYPL